jgi:hypothetical protein
MWSVCKGKREGGRHVKGRRAGGCTGHGGRHMCTGIGSLGERIRFGTPLDVSLSVPVCTGKLSQYPNDSQVSACKYKGV